MSGHSKWANIKFRKERQDAQRGKVFGKLIKEITIAARLGGSDLDANPRLRTAVQNAKAQNMPAKNIENAILKGTGELPGTVYEEVAFEGYGPGGVALYITTTTDNRNRTVAEIRHLLSKYGGNLGETGSVSWVFEKKGLIRVPSEKYKEDELMLTAIDAGADDFKVEDEFYEIYTRFEDLHKVSSNLENAGIEIDSAEITMVPQNLVELTGKTAEQLLRLMDALEDNDDVQNMFANFDIDETLMEKIQ
ncbi:MAG: YebC/PmpR family DNA-binding transcriptional regulator [Calditrichaeota bacterium]|nr:YebC/PmpR family DNA-binding transcriptional regulator [Calditrichota bacterium]RQW03241.1 MAG: YebC/PmpR family DNA-binding transcriptional regulator [Calditrichota bacterium]